MCPIVPNVVQKKDELRMKKMKTWYISLIVVWLITLMLQSCDKISSPYAVVKNSNIKDTVMSWDTVVAVRRVLLEDYTGHKCVNCPEATIAGKALEAQYGGKLIMIEVHAGYYALPGTGDYTLDLRTQAAEDWNNEFGITNNPSGLVNRKIFGTQRILTFDVWGASISQIISTAPDAEMIMTCTYDTSTRIVKPVVYTRFINQLQGTYKIILCVLENGIIGAQKNNNPSVGPTPDWFNYTFDDVVRGSVNGSWGETLTTSVNTSTTYLGRFSFALNTAWKYKNCYILAIVYNDKTKEIVQVIKRKII